MAVSCGKEQPAGDASLGVERVSLSASLGAAGKATVSTAGVVEWADGDRIGVYTSAGKIRAFDLLERSGNTATFAADLPAGETPAATGVFPYSAFKSFDGTTAVVNYPSVLAYADAAMTSPMAAVLSSGSLPFVHLGGLVSVDCSDVPPEAASFRLTAAGKRITGNFSFAPGASMSVRTEASGSGNTVKVTFTPGTAARRFNIPVPAGTYPSVEAGFYDSGDVLIYKWTLLENVTVEAGDMYLREPSFDTINGTAIDANNTRVGLITDASTGAGIPGVPVTDGYSYTHTDAHGVYQFVAHANARCVYISLPSGYEIPLAPDGEPSFWKTGSYRNDFSLTPRSSSWNDFSIVSFSDVHLWNTGENSTDELTKYRDRILPDLNATAAALDKVILLNTGDLVSNWTGRLADTRTEFAKIKKGGATVPMFPTIGNHDFNNSYSSTLECSQDWFDVYGPLQYSLNIGNAHIVCLNDLQYADGSNPGVYGKAIGYDKGLTDAQWDWLQADLATVSDKAGSLLILCVHAPVFNNDWAHAADLRGLLRTFGESHIVSGHNHYNVNRQFTSTWNGLSGRLSKEHNQQPLGGLWRTSLANDGSPMGYHVFSVSGNAIVRELFKAIGSDDASLQFRIYDGDAVYHDPLSDTLNGNKDADDDLLHFDWKTLWENTDDGDPSGKLLVRVFDAGTRGVDVDVYLNEGGVRTPMTHSNTTHRDQCAFSFFWNDAYAGLSTYWAQTCWQTRTQTWWYGPKPSSGDWKVEVEFTETAGTRHYESSTIHTDYTGFAW